MNFVGSVFQSIKPAMLSSVAVFHASYTCDRLLESPNQRPLTIVLFQCALFLTGANEAFQTWIMKCEEKMASKFRLSNYYISVIYFFYHAMNLESTKICL